MGKGKTSADGNLLGNGNQVISNAEQSRGTPIRWQIQHAAYGVCRIASAIYEQRIWGDACLLETLQKAFMTVIDVVKAIMGHAKKSDALMPQANQMPYSQLCCQLVVHVQAWKALMRAFIEEDEIEVVLLAETGYLFSY